MIESITKLVYLAAAVCFIIGLKRLSHPAKARSGNAIAATGMLVAIVTTLFNQEILSFQLIIIGMIVDRRCFRSCGQDDVDAGDGGTAKWLRRCRVSSSSQRGICAIHDLGSVATGRRRRNDPAQYTDR
jgi:hypothetical protein